MGHRLICAVLLCMVFMSVVCAAPDASPRYELSIRAGLSLEEALQELARQTGIQLLFFSQITAGRSAPELSGDYTLAAAMTRLLKGSDLTYRQVNEHTVEVRQAPPRSAARAPHKARQSTPASGEPMQEVQVIATAEQLVATRVPTPLQEIPQSVSIISSEQIRQQNSFELGDMLLNTPGFAVRRLSSIDQMAFSRAFGVGTFHVDGGSALLPALFGSTHHAGNLDLSEFDHAEVLRGSDALFSGNSNPGGTLSLVRKRPLPTPSFGMSATLGSWNNDRIELDATGPLMDNGALRARTDVVYATRDYFFKQAHQGRKKVFAAVEYDVTPTSTLTAGGSYQWDDALPLYTGALLNSDGSDPHLPRSTSLTFDWAFDNTRMSEAYLQYRQRFADDWILKLNTSVGRTIEDFGYGEFYGSINKMSGWVGQPTAWFSTRPRVGTLGTTDATLTGKLDWFGMREEVAIGADFTRFKYSEREEEYVFGPPLTNVLTFNTQAYPDPRGTTQPLIALGIRIVLKQYGGFFSLRVDVNDAWSLTGGSRVASDTLRGDPDGLVFMGTYVPEESYTVGSSHVVQPYGGVMYRFDDHLSWYASYADIYLTQTSLYVDSSGRTFGPQHGVTFESGVKGVWRDGALNGSLAVYRIEQQNVPVLTGAQMPVLSNSALCCYTSGAGRSRGAELEVDGELAPGWLIGSGYTYNLDKTGDGTVPQTSTPRHLLKIWTSAKLPGAFSRWTIGGGLRAQTTAPGVVCNAGSQTCTLGEIAYPRPYAVLDLRAGFELDKHWQVALGVNNVLDKYYYLSQNEPGYYNFWFGDPRNFMLRVDAKY